MLLSLNKYELDQIAASLSETITKSDVLGYRIITILKKIRKLYPKLNDRKLVSNLIESFIDKNNITTLVKKKK